MTAPLLVNQSTKFDWVLFIPIPLPDFGNVPENKQGRDPVVELLNCN